MRRWRAKRRALDPPRKPGRPRTCLCGVCFKCERTVERRVKRQAKHDGKVGR